MYGVRDPAVEAAVRAYVKLMRAARSVLARVEPGLAAEGLTPTQLGVLEAVLHKGALTQRQLIRKLLTSPGNMTDVIDKLERRGLVRRVRALDDRRVVWIELTEIGEMMITRVFPAHAAEIARAMGGLGTAELCELGNLLRALGRAAVPGGELESGISKTTFDIE